MEPEPIPQLPTATRFTDEALDAWALVAAVVVDRLPEPAYRLWVGPLELVGEADNAVCLHGSRKVAAWARRRYGQLIGETVRELTDYRGAFIGAAPEVQEVDACL